MWLAESISLPEESVDCGGCHLLMDRGHFVDLVPGYFLIPESEFPRPCRHLLATKDMVEKSCFGSRRGNVKPSLDSRLGTKFLFPFLKKKIFPKTKRKEKEGRWLNNQGQRSPLSFLPNFLFLPKVGQLDIFTRKLPKERWGGTPHLVSGLSRPKMKPQNCDQPRNLVSFCSHCKAKTNLILVIQSFG